MFTAENTLEPSVALKRVLRAQMQLGGERSSHSRYADYYDGNQYSTEMMEYIQHHRMPDFETNFVQASVNAVLGTEAQRTVDWSVRPDDKDSDDVAQALDVKLNEMMRMADANDACSEAYKSECVKGLGWVSVSRNTDPLGMPWVIESHHNNEIIYDSHFKRKDRQDMRFIARMKHLEADECKMLFPKHKKLIDHVAGSHGHSPFMEATFDSSWGVSGAFDPSMLMRDYEDMVATYVVHYRTFAMKTLVKFEDGKKAEYNPENLQHVSALYDGTASTFKTRLPVVRKAWFIASYLVEDEVSDDPHNMLPYVPFIGYREERTGEFYGLVKPMIGPQDAYNSANIQQHHLMRSVQLIINPSEMEAHLRSAENIDKLREQAAMADGVLIGNGIQIERHYQHIHQLEQVKATSAENIQRVSGITNAYQGISEGAQQSGTAVASLAQGSAAALAELNDNYEFARRQLGILCMAYVIEEIGDKQMDVPINNEYGEVMKTVELNKREGGQISNAVTMARYQVAMASIQSSEGYRAQNQQLMVDMLPQMPEHYRPPIVKQIIQDSQLHDRESLLKEIAKIEGVGVTEEERQQAAQAQAQTAEQDRELAVRQLEAEIAKTEAETDSTLAQAQKYIAEAEEEESRAIAQAEQNAVQQTDELEAQRQRKRQLLSQVREQIAENALAGAPAAGPMNPQSAGSQIAA